MEMRVWRRLWKDRQWSHITTRGTIGSMRWTSVRIQHALSSSKMAPPLPTSTIITKNTKSKLQIITSPSLSIETVRTSPLLSSLCLSYVTWQDSLPNRGQTSDSWRQSPKSLNSMLQKKPNKSLVSFTDSTQTHSLLPSCNNTISQ